MLHLPKKRPWLLIVILYVAIISVWITYIMVAKYRNEKLMTPDEAELYYKTHPRQIGNPEVKEDSTPPETTPTPQTH